jgi:hypothetical protein
MNDLPKVVFSKTLTRAEWPDSTIASGSGIGMNEADDLGT